MKATDRFSAQQRVDKTRCRHVSASPSAGRESALSGWRRRFSSLSSLSELKAGDKRSGWTISGTLSDRGRPRRRSCVMSLNRREFFMRRTSLAVRVGVDFANQESVLVQQRSGRLRPVRQGLPAAAHPLHGSGGVGVAEAVPELGKGLPQLFFITANTTNKPDRW